MLGTGGEGASKTQRVIRQLWLNEVVSVTTSEQAGNCQSAHHHADRIEPTLTCTPCSFESCTHNFHTNGLISISIFHFDLQSRTECRRTGRRPGISEMDV